MTPTRARPRTSRTPCCAPVPARNPAVPAGFPVRVEPVVSAEALARTAQVRARRAPARSTDPVSVGGATMGG